MAEKKGFGTTMGGGSGKFRTTCWSMVLHAADPNSPKHAAHLEELIERYWKPVYVTIRLGWHKTNDDAKDHTQAFFAYIIERQDLARIDPDRGSFRSYLRTALENFLRMERRAQKAEKRGGKVQVFSFDVEEVDLSRFAPSDKESPEKYFDRTWAKCVLSDGLKTLGEELRAQGKENTYEIFHAYYVAPGEQQTRTASQDANQSLRPTCAQLATQFDMTEANLKNHLTLARNRLRQVLQAAVEDYVDSPDEVENEIRFLLQS